MTHGLHHLTIMSSNAQKTYDFYTGILGLRFVKKTVNFDAPDVYHLYFGDEKGSPGTALTFFPFHNAGTGMRGVGQVTKISFAVPKESLGFWLERFVQKSVKHQKIEKRFRKSTLTFFDFDGLQLELVAEDESKNKGWTDVIKEEYAIKSFYSVELSVDEYKETEKILLEEFDYEFVENSENHYLYKNKKADYAEYLELFSMPGWPEGRQGAGTVHHVAFRVPTDEAEVALRENIVKAGLRPTEVIDRNYFHSVYFREPNGVLFEIATDEPGFAIDEDVENLGKELKLPPQYENSREQIENILPEIRTLDQGESNYEFYYEFSQNKESKDLMILFHGTGSNSKQLLNFAKEALGVESNILSVDGNILENGMQRFFKRFGPGEYDLENLEDETVKLAEFINQFIEDSDLEFENVHGLGFSNGANILQNLIFRYSDTFDKAFLLHPAYLLTPDEFKSKTEVILTGGKKDPYQSMKDRKKLEEIFKDSVSGFEMKIFEGYHEIGEEELAFLKEKI